MHDLSGLVQTSAIVAETGLAAGPQPSAFVREYHLRLDSIGMGTGKTWRERERGGKKECLRPQKGSDKEEMFAKMERASSLIAE